VPQTEAERQAEHQRLQDTETAESLATGKAQWHVRVELGSHHHAVVLARTLENEGRAVVRRWKFLIVGAGNEDQARELAGQIRQEARPTPRSSPGKPARAGRSCPPDRTVQRMRTAATVMEPRPPPGRRRGRRLINSRS
jgi:hypothetical protein